MEDSLALLTAVTYNRTQNFVKLLSDEEREIYQLVNYVIITGSISVFGVASNVINLLIFWRQGFTNSMNISFFSLSVSDLCSLVTLLWFNTCVNPLFVNSGVPMVTAEVQYLSAGIPHICFVRITGWITVFITAERCLCITTPLKIKQIITPKRTTVTVCAIYTITIASFIPEYQTSYLSWKFYPHRNKTMIALFFTSNRKSLEGLVYFFYSILGISAFTTVIVFTVVLIVALKKKTRWRKTANVDKCSGESISNRDKKTVSMVVLIATVLIVCYTPGIAVSLVTFFVPEVSIIGKYVNMFFVLWSFAFMFDALNASVNIFLYYNMSSKYRETFHQMFHLRTQQ